MEWTRNTAVFCLTLALAGCSNTPDVVFDAPVVVETPQQSTSSSSGTTETDNSTVSEPSAKKTAPGSVQLHMPFASQAPTGNWDPPYDEACEEASLILVHHYLEGTSLDTNIMDKDINAMVSYEKSIGLPIDIDMHELARVAREMFGYETTVIEGNDVTIERIERELARGIPVILPLAGQDIGNPYYSGDGPPYHVLVVVGYDDHRFITHDVGTKRGAYYTYNKDILMAAIHDWNGSIETIRIGPRRMLVVTK